MIAFRGDGFDVAQLEGYDFLEQSQIENFLADWTQDGVFPGGSAALALDFYNAVAGAGDPRLDAIELTGHSIGGGLAALVAAVYGQEAVVLDHVPEGTVLSALDVLATSDQAVRDAWYGGAAAPWAADGSAIEAYALIDEVLTFTRSELAGDEVTELSAETARLSDVELHSLPLATLLLWADETDHTGWTGAADELWGAFFNGLVLDAIPGIDAFVGEGGSRLTAMQSAIAYSALDEGERPFGDTALWALFDDAAELATAFEGDAVVFDQYVSPGEEGGDARRLRQVLADYIGAIRRRAGNPRCRRRG